MRRRRQAPRARPLCGCTRGWCDRYLRTSGALLSVRAANWSAVANGALRADCPVGGADDTTGILGRANAEELGRRRRDAGGIEPVVAIEVGGWSDQSVLVVHAVAE